jgi:predicted branched-subunit amino acid permease
MKQKNLFLSGFKAMLPIATGVVPFGAVMGTVCFDAKLSFFQTITMNILVYAGAAQLAATELMTKHASSIVVVATGLVINLRFLLYSAAMSPIVQRSGFLAKLACAHSLTDQGYAVLTANQDNLKTTSETIRFYTGVAVSMMLIWESSVIGGFIFGNFAPASLALDYAVPLSFMALVLPTLKNKNYVIVAAFSSVVSILLYPLPYKTSLIVTAALAIALGAFLSRQRVVQ